MVAIHGELDYPSLRTASTALCNLHTTANRVIFLLNGPADRMPHVKVKPAEITAERLETLKEADHIARTMVEEAGLTNVIWQFPVITIPISFKDGESIVLRPVKARDGMTASFFQLEKDLIMKMAERIGQLDGVDAVFLDATNKPPATIEWE